jgi:predicted transcriptional regulator
MLKATVETPDGRKLLIVGLSFANLDRFRAEPRDTMIKITGKEIGLDIDVMIFSAETEAHLAETIQEAVGPSTKIHVSPRLKQ